MGPSFKLRCVSAQGNLAPEGYFGKIDLYGDIVRQDLLIMAYRSLAGLSLRDLEYAVAVADLQHFGRAADRCGVSQAGLSEQVRKLEALFGCVLFERTTRRIAVTPEGAELIRQAREVLAAARVLLEMARNRTDPLAGPLRLGVISTLGPYYLPGVLWEVRTRFPALELRLQEGLTGPLLQELQSGALDLVLLALPPLADGLIAEPLFFEPFRALIPAGHALAEVPRLKVADLATDGLLLLEEGHCLRDQALSLCRLAHADGDARFASSLEMLRHMVAAGEGHSLVPSLAVRDDRLVRTREIDDPNVGRTVGLAWRGSDPRLASFQTFARLLRETAPTGTRAV
jgi:LysR family hydrogen peroxide-inducible transcriptional activator